MQAVYLLAGENSRFFPLNTMGHKAMSKLYGRPLLEYTMQELTEAGVKDHVFIVGKYFKDVEDYFGNGSKWEVRIQYAQQKEPKGQADAILSGKEFITEDFIVLNPYHFLQQDIFKGAIEKFHSSNVDAVLCGQYEDRIWEYGSFGLNGEKIIDIVEKPEKGKELSHIKKTSIEIYKREFLEYLEKASSEGFQNLNAIKDYIKSGKEVSLYEIDKNRYIPTLKYPWDLLEILENMAEMRKSYHVGEVPKLGLNSFIANSDIGDEVIIEDDVHIENSIIMDKVKIEKGSRIKDSIIGKDSIISEGVVIQSEKNGENIMAVVKGKEIDTERKAFGAVLGKEVMVGKNVKIAAGSLIEGKKEISANSDISGTIKDD